MKKKDLVSFLDAVGLALDHVSEVKTIDKSTGEPATESEGDAE